MDYWRSIAEQAFLGCAAYLRRRKLLQVIGTVVLGTIIFAISGSVRSAVWTIPAVLLGAYCLFCFGFFLVWMTRIPAEVHKRQVRIIRTLERELAGLESPASAEPQRADSSPADEPRRALR